MDGQGTMRYDQSQAKMKLGHMCVLRRVLYNRASRTSLGGADMGYPFDWLESCFAMNTMRVTSHPEDGIHKRTTV